MKNVKNFLNESVKFTDDNFNLYVGFNQKSQYEYVIIFPNGGVEMYSKDALTKLVKDDWDDVDLQDTYNELLELTADGKWHILSGPVGNDDLKDTIGQHCKK